MSLKIHSNAVILRYKSPISMILKRQWFQVFLGKVCRSSYHILIIKYIIKQCTAYFLHNVSSKYHFIYVSDIYSRCCYWYITCFHQIQTYLCKKVRIWIPRRQFIPTHCILLWNLATPISYIELINYIMYYQINVYYLLWLCMQNAF